jgi:Predicted nucleotide-binding protein containing TIR-like domain
MRPRVFIGSASSPDRMQTTMALAHRLQKDFSIVPKVWTYVFPPTESTLSSLIEMSNEMDFAVFVFGPDDMVVKSPTANPEGKGAAVEGETWTTRDNVIFELGLLIGTLGKERCFAVLPAERRLKYSHEMHRLHLLTDYLGTNYCTYIATKEPGLDPLDAVFAACQEIGGQIERQGPREVNAFQALFGCRKQAVVVYPDITASTEGIYTTEHHGGTLTEERHYWKGKQGDEHQIAHFDDVRAVNAIVELCGHQQVSVVATTDGLEQAQIHSLETISFSIGLLNGLTHQAFQIIARDTGDRINIRRDQSGPKKRKVTSSVILFNGESYPREAAVTQESTRAAARRAELTDEQVSFAIVVRTFLHRGGPKPMPRIVCGGIVASGTAAAGVYLNNNWRQLLLYYEDFGKDLQQDSLAVLLKFWGGKPESARPEAIRLCFFQPDHCEFHEYDPSNEGWKPMRPFPAETSPENLSEKAHRTEQVPPTKPMRRTGGRR